MALSRPWSERSSNGVIVGQNDQVYNQEKSERYVFSREFKRLEVHSPLFPGAPIVTDFDLPTKPVCFLKSKNESAHQTHGILCWRLNEDVNALEFVHVMTAVAPSEVFVTSFLSAEHLYDNGITVRDNPDDVKSAVNILSKVVSVSAVSSMEFVVDTGSGLYAVTLSHTSSKVIVRRVNYDDLFADSDMTFEERRGMKFVAIKSTTVDPNESDGVYVMIFHTRRASRTGEVEERLLSCEVSLLLDEKHGVYRVARGGKQGCHVTCPLAFTKDTSIATAYVCGQYVLAVATPGKVEIFEMCNEALAQKTGLSEDVQQDWSDEKPVFTLKKSNVIPHSLYIASKQQSNVSDITACTDHSYELVCMALPTGSQVEICTVSKIGSKFKTSVITPSAKS